MLGGIGQTEKDKYHIFFSHVWNLYLKNIEWHDWKAGTVCFWDPVGGKRRKEEGNGGVNMVEEIYTYTGK
jgi:hypothetical protein